MEKNNYEIKKDRLLALMDAYDHPVVACSAGADSALLTELAFIRHPLTALAVFVITEGTDEREKDYAVAEAKLRHWRLEILTLDTFQDEAVLHNRRDRCYFCKKMICAVIRNFGEENGGVHFLEGSNFDDKTVYRPGAQAVMESGFYSPLAEVGFRKTDVRRFGAALGLHSAVKPSAPCLMTRFPYDAEEGIQRNDIERIKTGEHHLKTILSDNFRLRFINGQAARIEASAADQDYIKTHFSEIVKGIPFSHVILDEKPFQSGSYDQQKGNGR
jgi:uncharacterized protein